MDPKNSEASDSYQPPPLGVMYPPPYSTGPSPIMMQPRSSPEVIIIQQSSFGPETQRMTCTHCRAEISTRVEHEPGSRTHCFALLLCVVGLWPCVCVPYCTDSCLSQRHYCPHCNVYLGEHKN